MLLFKLFSVLIEMFLQFTPRKNAQERFTNFTLKKEVRDAARKYTHVHPEINKKTEKLKKKLWTYTYSSNLNILTKLSTH